MVGRYDSNPFDEEEEVNPFSDPEVRAQAGKSPYSGGFFDKSVPQVNTMSPLPHEPIFSGSAAANNATVDIPLGSAKELKKKEKELKAKEDALKAKEDELKRKEEMKEDELKRKEEMKEDALKAKEDALKAKEDELKRKEEMKEDALKAKEDALKAKEDELKRKEEMKEDALKAKEDELKRKEEEMKRKEEDELKRKEEEMKRREEAGAEGMLKLVEWLNQSLDRPEFKFGNRPYANHRVRDWPKKFLRWNICGEADSFRHSFDGDTKGYRRVEINFPEMTENEAVSTAIMMALLDALQVVPVTPGFRVSLQDTARLMETSRSQVGTSSLSVDAITAVRQASSAAGTRGITDIGCVKRNDTKKLFYIIEMKRASLCRDRETDPLPQLLDVLDGFHGSGSCLSARERCMAQSIGQLFTYMVAKSIGYGALSTADATYFIRRSVDNTIYVSQGFPWEDGDFLKTLAYTIHCGYEDTNCYNTEGMIKKRFSSPKPPHSPSSHFMSLSDPSSGSSKENSSPQVDSESSNLQGSYKMTANSADSSGFCSWDYTLIETRAEDLNMEDQPFVYGWSGNVLKGVYHGVPIAIKLAPCNSECAQALVNEAHTYLKLQGLWGYMYPTWWYGAQLRRAEWFSLLLNSSVVLSFSLGRLVCSWGGRLFKLLRRSITAAFCTVIFGLATLWCFRMVCACWILAFQGASGEAVIRMMLPMRSSN